MNKKLYGFYNRKTLVYDDFVIFESLDSFKNYYRAVYELMLTGKYTDYQFADYILYPHDYNVSFLGDLISVPKNPVDCTSYKFVDLGDFSDLLNIMKESDDNGKREDVYHSEQIYSDSSPRS